jgi:hypothetical protein
VGRFWSKSPPLQVSVCGEEVNSDLLVSVDLSGLYERSCGADESSTHFPDACRLNAPLMFALSPRLK